MNSLQSRRRTSSSDDENPYWISFADLMAGLLVIFILAVIALILELTQKSMQWDQAIEEIAIAEQVRRDILDEIKIELEQRNIRVEIVDNNTILRIPEDVLSFERGSYDLPQEESQRDIVHDIGRVLYSSITKNDRWQFLDTVFVEGHSDSTQNLNTAIKGNWGLSTFRAISVWDFWNSELVQNLRLDSLYNHAGRKLFSVSGYAETRFVPCTNDDPNVNDSTICPEGSLDNEFSHQRNRRIDLRFTVRRPALEDYQDLRRSVVSGAD